MRLEEIRLNDGTIYFDKETGLACQVLVAHPSDGTKLIVEYLDEDLDPTEDIALTCASSLEKYVYTAH